MSGRNGLVEVDELNGKGEDEDQGEVVLHKAMRGSR